MSKELRTIRTLKLKIADTATTLNALINYKMKDKDLHKKLKRSLSARLATLCAVYLSLTHDEATTNALRSYLLNTLPEPAANYFLTKLNIS